MLKRFYTYHMIVNHMLRVLKEQSPEVREEFLNAQERDLCTFHHGLGTFIRNTFGLWDKDWTPEIRNDVDWSPNHPDAVSARIIRDVWRLARKGATYEY